MQGISLSRNLLRLMRSVGLTELSPSNVHLRSTRVCRPLPTAPFSSANRVMERPVPPGFGDRHRVHSFRGCALTMARFRLELFSTFRAAAPRTKLARYY
jgi:hypothetical protein